MSRTMVLIMSSIVTLLSNLLPMLATTSEDVRLQPTTCRDTLLEPADAREDIDILQAALEEAHPGVHRYAPKIQLDRLFDDARRAAGQPMCAIDLYRVLAPIVGEIKCGHTSLLPADSTVEELNTTMPILPLAVRILGSQIFVISDYGDDAEELRGAELLGVNGHPATKLLATLLSAVRGDGDSETAGRWRLGEQFLFSRRLFTMIGIESPFRVEFILRGRRGEMVVEGVTFPKLQQLAGGESRSAGASTGVAKYRALGRDVALLRLERFADEVDGKPSGTFLDEVFTDLVASKKKVLILDLRGNGGGSDEFGAQLFAHFVNQPFQYYGDLVVNKLTFEFYRYAPGANPLPAELMEKRADGTFRLVKHPNWGLLQPAAPFFGGKVIILADGGSFSTTCEFLSKMKDSKRATLVGEESGGGFTGNTSGPGPNLILPHSRLQIQIRLLGYYMAVGDDHDARRGVVPDVAIRYSIADVLEGRDLGMKAARRLASRPGVVLEGQRGDAAR